MLAPVETSFNINGVKLEGELWKDNQGNEWIKVKENNKSTSYPVVKNAQGEYDYKVSTPSPKLTKVPIIKNNTFSHFDCLPNYSFTFHKHTIRF